MTDWRRYDSINVLFNKYVSELWTKYDSIKPLNLIYYDFIAGRGNI